MPRRLLQLNGRLLAGAMIGAIAAFMSALVFGYVTTRSDVNQNTELVADNQALACAFARLISYVPAIQFEGEPLSNFRGWVASRRDLLVEVRDGCSPEIQLLLAKRVELDQQVLDDLDKQTP